ncbi:WD40 repeat-like protein [Dentipellis sp. KUC8613]|nr:WD40 repeat-like protein [Dentipellis sp. KUC8613]
MSSLRYVASHKLVCHSDAIVTIDFHQDGRYIAAGGLDNKLSVWNVDEGSLEVIVTAPSPLLCVQWSATKSYFLVAGLEDGHIIFMTMDNVILITGFKGHDVPVECVAQRGALLATGSFREVRVWEVDDKYRSHEIGLPPTNGWNRESEVLVTSVHWKDESTLLVSYMHHGILIWDAVRDQLVTSISISTAIGSTSLSPSGRYLAVSNIRSGFDVYDLQTNSPVRSYRHTTGKDLPVPVLFVHEGFAIMGGSGSGEVDVWDASSLISTRHSWRTDQLQAQYRASSDVFLIATGMAKVGKDNYIQLWRSKETRRSCFTSLFVPLINFV